MISEKVNNGARVPVIFEFFSGIGGVSRRAGADQATIAIRENLRGAQPGPGTVDGKPVEVLKIARSPSVTGMTVIDVRFLEEQEAE